MPPSMDIKVASELPFRKSRRFTAGVDLRDLFMSRKPSRQNDCCGNISQAGDSHFSSYTNPIRLVSLSLKADEYGSARTTQETDSLAHRDYGFGIADAIDAALTPNCGQWEAPAARRHVRHLLP